MSSTLRAIALARWCFVIASVLATLVTNPNPQSAGLVLTVALVAGNLAVLRGLEGAVAPKELRRLAAASVLLDLTVAIVWVILDTGSGRGQMYLALGLVGVEVAALWGQTATLALLVAIMAVLGGADVVGYAFFGRPEDFPTTILRVAMLWSIVLLSLLLLRGGSARRGGVERRSGTEFELAEQRFQEVLDGAPNAIIAADDEGKVMLVNAAALRLFDHTRREIIGRPASSLVPGIYADLPHGSGARYLTKEISTAGKEKKWEGVRRDGVSFHAEVSYSTLQLGQRVLVAASVRDITDRIKAEQERDAYKTQLEEAQRLESLGRLAGGIAHDFNNMLNVILNYTDFVEEATNSDPTIKSDLGEIRSAGKRAARLTQQLLRLAGREALRPEPMDLREEIATMEGRLRSMLPPRGRLQVVIPNSLSLVLGDPTMLNEVLGILVDNSVQAMPDGGEIVIEATDMLVTPAIAAQQPDLTPGKYVVMSVSDTGVGMDEETRSRALEPFFTTRVALGGGLGLPTAYGLVRQSGGTLVIESTPGKGTTVEVYMPAASEEAAIAASVSTPLNGEQPRRKQPARALDMILLLDHDDAVRTRTADILIRNNFEVVEARDGAEALRVAVEEQARLKLVMVDRVMGSMLDTGLPDMLKSLLPDAKMILMSTFSRSMLSSQGLDDSSLPFMSKDFSEDELLEKVHEVIAGGAPRPTAAKAGRK
ncbi:MAG TPA: PAS domain S-box protein [Candidatus Dormibacteraeota bacterium]|nr:PAS domain S-box protein [Candidatus Dormibacteraeota bacterium]